jgi:hypothetical protein
MEQQVRIALEFTSCGRREKTNNEEIFCSKSRPKLEEHSGRIKISNTTQGFVLIRNDSNNDSNTRTK